MKILLIFVSILVVNVLGVCCDLQKSLGRNQTCTTPYQEQAKCISIYDCDGILEDIVSGDKDRLDFVKQSHCGADEEPLVCCGNKSYGKDGQTNTKRRLPITRTRYTGISISDLTTCGLDRGQLRIVGGEVTGLDEFPWMAALEYVSKIDRENAGIRCGGSLITNRYILTAAHCIYDIEFDLVRAWLGEWDITKNPDCVTAYQMSDCADDVKKIAIEKKILHPSYRRRTFRDDIGLLRLETEVQYTDYILPICLPTQDQPLPDLSTRMFVAGWGSTENGTQSNVKLKVMLPLVPNEKCNIDKVVTNGNQICAGGEMGKDSCSGDSGGPLMRFEHGGGAPVQWFQEGIVSYGKGCGYFPSVYTRVSRYVEWIKNVIKEE